MKKWMSLPAILVLALAWWPARQETVVPAPAPLKHADHHVHVTPPVTPVARKPSSAPVAPTASAPALPAQEQESLDEMGTTLSQAELPTFSLYRLVDRLKKSGQQPVVIKDSNPDTGEMTIVRTKSPLPGTRYFHAQYFTGEDGERFVQHMSFEFKPGPQSMAAAIATVERNFPNLSRPKIQRDDYVQWDWNDKYIVWIKRMGVNDLQDDPFNSYSASDDGTIRVAVELEIHGE